MNIQKANNSQIFIEALLVFIENNNSDEFFKLLNKLKSIKTQKQDTIVKFMIILLNQCKKWNRYTLTREIFYHFDSSDKVLNQDSYFFQFFYDYRIDLELMKFLVESFNMPDRKIELDVNKRPEVVTWAETIDVFIKGPDAEHMIYACSRSIELYGERTLEEYELVKKRAEKAKRYYILNFFEDRIKNLSEYAEEPEYVDTYYDDEELTKNEIQDLLPAVEFKNFSKETLELEPSVISKFYIDYLSFGDLIPDDIPKTINKLSSTYKSLDTTAKLAFIEPISILIANQDKDVELFRLMGPSNPYLELSDSEINYCTLYRCRMLHCNCNEISFEYEDIDNAEKEDWFQKPNEEYATCDYCNKKLELPSDCVRIPLVGGGWQGRFCNDSVNENDEYVPFLCALSWLNEREKNIEKKIDLNKRRMIKIVSSKLEEYGLQRQTD